MCRIYRLFSKHAAESELLVEEIAAPNTITWKLYRVKRMIASDGTY